MTITLPRDLVAAAAEQARAEARPLAELIADAIAQYLGVLREQARAQQEVVEPQGNRERGD